MRKIKDPFLNALNHAYRLLAVRDRSENEIRERLKIKGYGRRRIDEVIERLKSQDYLNDMRFAKDWVTNRALYSQRSVFAIRDELLKKGISAALIDEVMKDEKMAAAEYETAKALADKKIKSLGNIDAMKLKKSVYSYLARRGFSFDVINEIVDEI